MKHNRDKRKVGVPIAVRYLRVSGAKRRVVVKIGVPRKARGNWECLFEISGLKGQDGVRGSWGVDSMQALMLAFDSIRQYFDASGETLTWIGGEPGDEGFPLSSDTGFGRLKLRRRIERFIKTESARHQRRIERARLRYQALSAARRIRHK